jgi:patatin-like phospholipase/acyl hydrolase
MDSNTIRVISFDGGGTRGIMQLFFLEKLIVKLTNNPKKITEQQLINSFDVIAGTSIGGIIALCLSFGLSIENIKAIFIEKAKRIFTIQTLSEIFTTNINAKKDSNRPNKLEQLIMIANDYPFYKSKSSKSNYGSNVLHQVLIDIFGNSTLKDLKIPVIVPAYQKNNNKIKVFSNINSELYIGQNARIVDVARATSAAPIYLPPYSFDGNTYVDGGVFCNDPVLLAIELAKTIKIHSKKMCILQLGTGIKDHANSIYK